jgi:HEAT repeat protein
MMENVTVLRAVQTVLDGGEKHKSGVVRAEASRLVDLAVTRLGAERVMGCSKEMKALLVKRASRFLSDPSPDARKFSRHAFAELNTHRAFDALLMQMLGENERRDVRKALAAKA